MFETLFKYPLAAFRSGQLLFLEPLPKWLLALLICVVALGLAAFLWNRHGAALGTGRLGAVWALETLTIATLLFMLWQPAIAVTQLKPQQNIIAIMVDRSGSMRLPENGATREEEAARALQSGFLTTLQKSFQTRLYQFDTAIARIGDPSRLVDAVGAGATHIGASLRQLLAENADLPLGAIVLLSDGGDNAGGVDADTLRQLRNRRVPVYTVGFGGERRQQDVEIEDVVVTPRALAESRLSATVKLQQQGFDGQRSVLTVREGGRLLSSQPVVFASGGNQTENILFNVGAVGAKTLLFSVQPLEAETNRANNTLTRLVNVQPDARRILYFEGEPRWEYKFIHRAADDDPMLRLASLLRTTENKIYRQGIDNAAELAGGFPTRAEELFAYQGLIIGSVDAGYFTPAQQRLIHDFVDRRGGGVLFLGGRQSLTDGVWSRSDVSDLMPVVLPGTAPTFHREAATPRLTALGAESVICRLVDDPQANAQRWKTLPYLMDYQDPGVAKPGASVLAQMTVGARTMPLLVTQRYGRGRTAVLATGGTWRWQMSLPLGDKSHDLFWQQLLRWLVSDTRDHVAAEADRTILFDAGETHVAADVRDMDYNAASDVQVTARVIGPAALSAQLDLNPVPNRPGRFSADWSAPRPGTYVTEVTARRGGETLGSDVVTFQRSDGVAEQFHTEQNRALLETLARSTGGRYVKPADLPRLAADIPYSRAGVSVQQTSALWNMPILFVLLLAFRGADWLLRRAWGVV